MQYLEKRRAQVNSKSAIINKVLKHYMGGLDFIAGDFKNKTIPVLKKIEKSAHSTAQLIDLLLASKILKIHVTFTETKERWKPTQEPLVVFLSARTHWEFWTEGLNEYLIRTEGGNADQGSILFEQKTLSPKTQAKLRQWLLA